ncbi:MAG: hydrogenase expression/formation protein HypE [Abditibacteriota bacterium]|nr:hydrogenase expression/formation protein HypE [Abditibacteriota bacterium]
MTEITLSAGAGGRASLKLAEEVLFPILGGRDVNGYDAAVIDSGRAAVSTDSYVVSPLFFPGGSIGVLAAAGSINDVLTTGARPQYLTCALIIEEGLSAETLSSVLKDLRREADRNGVTVVSGDTKVVPKGQCDKIFINTACIGTLAGEAFCPGRIEPGDAVIVTGCLGEHECSLMISRNRLGVEPISSDCAGLAPLILPFAEAVSGIKAMRDPTRGGIASALNELALQSGCSMEIDGPSLPVSPQVRAFCGAMGLDVTCLANEGKMLIFVSPGSAGDAVEWLRSRPGGRDAAVIGRVTDRSPEPRVVLKTEVASRLLPMPSMEQVPRIC